MGQQEMIGQDCIGNVCQEAPEPSRRTAQLFCAVKYDYSVDAVVAYNVRENQARLQEWREVDV